MQCGGRKNIMNYKKFLRPASAALMIVMVVLILMPGAWAAGKYKVLYRFTGGADGSQPYGGLIFDQAGNLYGTTAGGTVFKLTPNPDGSWTESVIYSLSQGSYAGLTFDQAGNLYGTTFGGSPGDCYWRYICGYVFELSPNSDGSWTENEIYGFGWGSPFAPAAGVIFDRTGNLYGTTTGGGGYGCGLAGGCGAVFQLTPNPDGSWTLNLLHSFSTGTDGSYPAAGLIFDQAGNLYGTTSSNEMRRYDQGVHGTVFELTPNPDGSWAEIVLYDFSNLADGGNPEAGLIFDQAGNLYGTTVHGGGSSSGAVFELTPNPDGSWTETVLHHFNGKNGAYPYGSLVFDAAGNLYGTTSAGGAYGYGVIFRLKPNASGGWNATTLYSFVGHPGAYPHDGLILDAAGNLYGTTTGDGTTTFGSVFEITP